MAQVSDVRLLTLDQSHSTILTKSGPFTREVAETLRLRNPGSESIAFKVRLQMSRLFNHALTRMHRSRPQLPNSKKACDEQEGEPI